MIQRFAAVVSDKTFQVSVEALEGDLVRIVVDGRERTLSARRVAGGAWSLLPAGGGVARFVDVDGAGPDYSVTTAGQVLPIKLVEARRAAAQAALSARPAATGPLAIRSPMPGKVVKILVKAGEVVKAQQGVIVVEAMKMENELKAPRDGTIVAVGVQEGQAVEASAPLLTIG
jgi:biotin carboxyl carrier protein